MRIDIVVPNGLHLELSHSALHRLSLACAPAVPLAPRPMEDNDVGNDDHDEERGTAKIGKNDSGSSGEGAARAAWPTSTDATSREAHLCPYEVRNGCELPVRFRAFAVASQRREPPSAAAIDRAAFGDDEVEPPSTPPLDDEGRIIGGVLSYASDSSVTSAGGAAKHEAPARLLSEAHVYPSHAVGFAPLDAAFSDDAPTGRLARLRWLSDRAKKAKGAASTGDNVKEEPAVGEYKSSASGFDSPERVWIEISVPGWRFCR